LNPIETTADASPPPGHPVLVVDDNAVNQLVTCEFLRTLGYAVESADDGRAALERLEAQHYCAVLMDVQMPGMDGIEATRCLRQREAAQGLTPKLVIALTANAFDSDRERALAAGMDDFITKPVRLDQLARTLAQHLKIPR
jgi:two-component system, sensor histidine kinase and response regulator